jgi:cyclopropane fatty-acyl-phospholipid synthase-like methyltransferase
MRPDIYTDSTYLSHNPTWHVEDSAWKAEQIVQMLSSNGLHPHTVCEVGCGAGEILSQLHTRLPPDVTFHGYDISPQAIALAQQRQRDRLSFHLADLLTEPADFDLVLAMDVLEHVPDYLGFLGKLRDKGVHHLFHIPLDMNVQMVLRSGRLLRERTQSGHLHYFSKETALATLRDAGYQVVDRGYTAGGIDLPSRSLLHRVAKWPRRTAFALHQDLAVRLLGGYSLLVLTVPSHAR